VTRAQLIRAVQECASVLLFVGLIVAALDWGLK
jgi:hypothetical protein